MKKIFGIVFGSLAILAGLILSIIWLSDLLAFFKTILAVTLIIGGVIGVLAGVSEYKDAEKLKKQ